MFEKIKEKIKNSIVYKTGDNYKYFVYPYKGINPIDPKEINYLGDIISLKIKKDVDFLFTFETDGIFIAYSVASILNKPLVVARKFHYNFKNPTKLVQQTGYYKRNLFFSINDCNFKKVAIIDCVYSTGGSIGAALKTFNNLNIEVVNVCVVINKINYNNSEFFRDIENKFFAVYDVEIKDNNDIRVNKSEYFTNSK